MTTFPPDAATIESSGLGLPQSALDVGASWDEEKLTCVVLIGNDRFRLRAAQTDAALIGTLAGRLDALAAEAPQQTLNRAFALACRMASYGLGAPGVHPAAGGGVLLKWRRGRRELALTVQDRKAQLSLTDAFGHETRMELARSGRWNSGLIAGFLGTPASSVTGHQS